MCVSKYKKQYFPSKYISTELAIRYIDIATQILSAKRGTLRLSLNTLGSVIVTITGNTYFFAFEKIPQTQIRLFSFI